MIVNGFLAKADPGHHAAQEAVAFLQGEERVHHLAVHQPEIAGVERDGDVRDAGHEPVECLGCPTFEGGLTLAFGPHAVGDVGAPAPAFQHLGDDLGRVLQVGVDEGDGIAGGFGQTAVMATCLSEIARQGDDPHARIGPLESSQKVQCGIAAAVVDVDELEVECGDVFEGGDKTAVRLGDDRFLVVAGDDDGQKCPVGVSSSREKGVLSSSAITGASPREHLHHLVKLMDWRRPAQHTDSGQASAARIREDR